MGELVAASQLLGSGSVAHQPVSNSSGARSSSLGSEVGGLVEAPWTVNLSGGGFNPFGQVAGATPGQLVAGVGLAIGTAVLAALAIKWLKKGS